MRDLEWTRLDRRTVYEGPIFSVHRDRARPPGEDREAVFDVVTSPDWVNMIVLTERREIVLVRQYRHGTGDVTLEIPGGMVDPGETPLQAAQREVLEETGYRAERWEPLGRLAPNPAFLTNHTHVFLALDARREGAQDLGENEDIEVVELPLAEIPGRVADGTITHALVIGAFFHLAVRQGVTLG